MPTASENKSLNNKDIIEQVKESGHYKFFATMVAGGPEGTQKAHYSDACIGCHSAVKMFDDKNAKLSDFFANGKYAGLTEGVTCRVCHELKGDNGITLKKQGWAVCSDCHTSGSRPKLGSEVHHPQGEMIKGVGVGEVEDTPSYKCFNMIDFTCYDCHVTNTQKHDFMIPGVTVTHDGVMRTSSKIDYEKFKDIFKQEKCKSCHAIPEDAANAVKKTQTEIGKKLEELKPIYDDWSKKAATMDKNDPKVKAFRNGATYFTYVETDSSKGAHNYELTKKLLAKAEENFILLK